MSNSRPHARCSNVAGRQRLSPDIHVCASHSHLQSREGDPSSAAEAEGGLTCSSAVPLAPFLTHPSIL
jgi:hypothetical protein